MIAVVGCQRSGTTLAGQILGAHPNAVLIDEGDGLYPWFAAEANGSDDAEPLARTMLRSAAAKYRDAGSRFLEGGDGVALSAGVTALVLKAPNLTYDDAELAGLGVAAAVVYPVRDPRAVVASMIRLPGIDFVGNQCRLIAERPPAAARYAAELRDMRDESKPRHVREAVMWRVKSARANDFERHGAAVSRFRYEDLVREPEPLIVRLLSACGLEPSERALQPHAAYTGYGPGGIDRTRPIDGASAGSWREALDETRQRDVLAAAGPLAASFGYG